MGYLDWLLDFVYVWCLNNNGRLQPYAWHISDFIQILF